MQELEKAYDPEEFRRSGHQLVDQLADYLKNLQGSDPPPVIQYREAAAAKAYWQEDWDQREGRDLSDFYQKLLKESIALHHPNYMGHQISPPLPVAALSGLATDLLNNGMGVYEMGIAATAIEQLIIKQIALTFGYGEKAGGFMTAGGTLANLTALLAARSCKIEQGIWENGTHQAYAVMVSEQAHYCIDRAVRIMGWGTQGIIKIKSDDQFRMDTRALASAFEVAAKKGIRVIAVVGSACSTAVGAYDDLETIGQFCEQHQLWFHVDGAHGAPAIFSNKYKHLVKGINRADSIAMDFHKMMMTPALATGLFFKNEQQSYQTFAQKASYLWEQEGNDEWYNLAKRTFECTKYMMSVKVYSIIRTHGINIFSDFVTRLYDLGQLFANRVAEHPDWELATWPQANIVCFRKIIAGKSASELNQVNRELRKRFLLDGHFYLVQTEISEIVYLRVSLMNPFTDPSFSFLDSETISTWKNNQ